MHPIKKQLNDLIEYFRASAELEQFRRRIDERMFLFAIEIGQKQPLKFYERHAYLKSYPTALSLLMTDEMTPKSRGDVDAFRKIFAEAKGDWLRHAHIIQQWLERERARYNLPDFANRSLINFETRRMLVAYLEHIARKWPEVLALDEIDDFIDRLENPLDRA